MIQERFTKFKFKKIKDNRAIGKTIPPSCEADLVALVTGGIGQGKCAKLNQSKNLIYLRPAYHSNEIDLDGEEDSLNIVDGYATKYTGFKVQLLASYAFRLTPSLYPSLLGGVSYISASPNFSIKLSESEIKFEQALTATSLRLSPDIAFQSGILEDQFYRLSW